MVCGLQCGHVVGSWGVDELGSVCLSGVWGDAVRHSKIPHQFSIAQQNAKGFLLYRAFVHPIKNRRLHKISERWMVQIFDSIFK